MRKFKRFPPRSLRFPSLLLLATALMLLAAFAPRANADLIAYYNFEGTPTAPYPVNLESHAPAFFSSGNNLILTYNVNGTTAVTPGLPQNLWPGDPAPNLTALGLSRSGANSPSEFDIPLFSSQGFFQDLLNTEVALLALPAVVARPVVFQEQADAEALVNTAGGLLSGILGIFFYNFFVNKVDSFNYTTDEATFEVLQILKSKEGK